MKRSFLLLLYMWIALLALPGCGTLDAGRREVEQLQIMETMGVDHAPGGLRLTLAPSEGEGPCLSAEGVSLPDALERLRELSVEEDIFCGHVRQLLIGEEAAQTDLRNVLEVVCRSSDLRLDLPIYVLRGATAHETMTGAGGEEGGITQAVQSLRTKLPRDERSWSAGRILRDLERSGSALLPALDFREAAEEDTHTAAPDGYAVIRDGRLVRFLDRDQALGVSFLRDQVGADRLVLQDLGGLPVTLEIDGGSLQLRPILNDSGALTGLELNARVRSSLLDAPELGEASREQYADYLTGQLETAVSRQISQVLQLSKQLKTDFLGLGPRLELAAPETCRGAGRAFGRLLPGLELSIAVRGELSHSGDTN